MSRKLKHSQKVEQPYLIDTNGQRVYEGERIWIYQGDEKSFGTLKRTPDDDPYCFMYPWLVIWQDIGETYWTGIHQVWKG